MKVRNGFVSNSSSSSFVINLEDISAKQLKKIQSHKLRLEFWQNDDDEWTIDVDDDKVSGHTWMDNFDMHEYLKDIGVDMSKVKWEHS